MNTSSLSGKACLVTGHTGFKGAWLSCWLDALGAQVTGLSFDPDGASDLHRHAGNRFVREFSTDLRDAVATAAALQQSEPEVVFHLAAQPLVRRSYADPLLTWTTNVIGTANLLEACRRPGSVKSVVVVTTDKCYENREWLHPYRESDRLGGRDPYSASKAAAELVTASYRESFLSAEGVRVATARAGNVFGGGDWAADRLVPDAVRAFAAGTPLAVRNPSATRPWQHVLEPLWGYLLLAERLLQEPDGGFDRSWNFGPDFEGIATVERVARQVAHLWGDGRIELAGARTGEPHEAGRLQLDASLAKSLLGWRPRWGLDTALRHCIDWYRRHAGGERAASLMLEQITLFEAATPAKE